MASDTDEEELRRQVEALESRLERIEDIFSPNLLDRQTKHAEAQGRDARDVLSSGEEKVMTVISPCGEGQAPDKLVGKVHGIVTFTDCRDACYEEGEHVRVTLTNIAESSAEGIVLGPFTPEEDSDEATAES